MGLCSIPHYLTLLPTSLSLSQLLFGFICSGFFTRALSESVCASRDRARKGILYALCVCVCVYIAVTLLKKLIPFPITKFKQARIWDYFQKQKHEILEDSLKTLEKAELQMDQDVSILGYEFAMEQVKC